jgi:hypothetical protein
MEAMKMNRRFWQTALLSTLVAALVSTAASAQSENTQSKDPPRASDQQGAAPAAATPAAAADAPNARLAGLVRRDLVVVRNKNIMSVKRIAAGVYCITPTAAAGITPNRAIVMLTPEYYFSLYSEIKVQWAFRGSGCNSNQLAVYTLADPNFTGQYRFSNAVSFSIVVP